MEEEGEAAVQLSSEQAKQKKKKGNWKFIGHEPANYELHPCPHRYKRVHPKGPCIQYKQIRWVVMPLSDRLKQLAMPLLRRLLALWLEFGDKLPPEMRARLLQFMIDNYGLSEEFLEGILAEAIAARNKTTEKKKKKKKKKRKRKKKKKKKKEKEQKPKKEKKQSSLLYKRRKPGKLPLDWPYKTGTKFLMMCISYLSGDPDEDFNSRASEYFDVQAMAVLQLFCNCLEMNLPDPDKPTQYGEALIIMALNLSDWIAKNITAPASAIPDDKVEEYLELRGVVPKKPKPVAAPKGKKGKPPPPPPEPVTEVQRDWEEHKLPVYVPEKGRISRRKQGEETEEVAPTNVVVMERTRIEELYYTETNRERTLDEVKQDFLEYINWYNPWDPEFMYMGPRMTPGGIAMFKIYDCDSDDVPNDMRVLNWNQIESGYIDDYSFVPGPVPQYYPCIRPLRPLRADDLEKSGFPREVMKRNVRFFSPWYLMRVPLKPPPPPPPPRPLPAPPPEDGYLTLEEYGEMELELQMAADIEEVLEDEMLAMKEPPVQDSLWNDYVMKEQFAILCHLLHLMISVPDLTLEYLFEMLEEFCEAVECAEEGENPTPENVMLMKKRTIIIERYYLSFFGKKFRDYNDRTPYYMRVICRRCAYYIQLLYEHTARILWQFQSQPNPPSPIPSRPVTPDDPDALRDWDEWLAWLLRVTKTCDEWAGWISETVNEAERKAAKKKNEFVGPDGRKVPLTAEEWFGWKKEVEKKVWEYRSSKKQIYKESPYYLEKAKHILPVKHRQKICQWVTEIYGEGGEREQSYSPRKGRETETEEEWEDVGEVD